ncbi:hypothetical protein [Nocardia sp. NPDC020380]|uniref:hypothetical protein n=1 Tax=Nocardia sp. NPDC020380 TaxID=3364309 RepID=UPI00378DFC34
MPNRSRYENLLHAWSGSLAPHAAALAEASAAARAAVPVDSEHQQAVRDVTAGVVAPALVGYVLWTLKRAESLGLDRLCFLSRDGQVFHEIAQRLAPRLAPGLELEYAYSSRRTWSLAAADLADLSRQDWLFNSFIRSNAEDVLARLGLPPEDFLPLMEQAGVSLNPELRADQAEQGSALRAFTGMPAVSRVAAPRIERMRELVRAYAVQTRIASARSGVVDAGWTGRMIGALTTVTEGLPQPHVFFWAHEPRVTGWTDRDRVSAYMYNTDTKDGVDLRVPDTPFVIETFCMSDHGIVADFQRLKNGEIVPVLESETNQPVEAWGLKTVRHTIDGFCDALPTSAAKLLATTDVRPLISLLLHTFWITPTTAEAVAWGAYPYDSDPMGRSMRPLARPFDQRHLRDVIGGAPLAKGDRAWLQGSLALSGEKGRAVAARLAPTFAVAGAPATD